MHVIKKYEDMIHDINKQAYRVIIKSYVKLQYMRILFLRLYPYTITLPVESDFALLGIAYIALFEEVQFLSLGVFELNSFFK